MLIVIDVGNTNTVFAPFNGATPLARWRMRTRRYYQADDLGAFLLGMLAEAGKSPGDVADLAIASVVPPLTLALEEMARRYFHKAPFVLQPGVNVALASAYDNPRLLGADRAANALAVARLYGGPAVVADFGTASKFEAIGAAGEYLGGAIAPGLNIAADTLVNSADLLHRPDLTATPPHAIAHSTEDALLAGISLGYLALAEGLITRLRAELARRNPTLDPAQIRAIATGGLAQTVARETSAAINVIDPDLTLQGIRIAYDEAASYELRATS